MDRYYSSGEGGCLVCVGTGASPVHAAQVDRAAAAMLSPRLLMTVVVKSPATLNLFPAPATPIH